MKKDKLSKKGETMIFAISVTLMLYINRIYGMASINYDDAMVYIKDEDVVEFALRIHMKEVITEFEYYRAVFGTGREKYEYIDVEELLKMAMFYHDLYIKDMLIKNLEEGQTTDENGLLNWNLNLGK
ncbi:TPA: hypothetical protein ACQJLA_001401 [Raoultella ornithinolytica]